MNVEEPIKLYLDEHMHGELARALSQRGFDVATTVQAGGLGASDEEQLALAVSQNRTICTFDRENYARLHNQYLKSGWEHYGIIVSDQYPIGEVLRRLLNLLATLSAEDMCNRLEYLSQWAETRSR
jgi:predicted nuclease of predicted toxin-antitoxin system